MKNLFDYATKELSQDAFLRWLFENYNCENEKVRQVCQSVLGSFVGRDDFDINQVQELRTFSQWKKIDILVVFKYKTDCYCIVIEDKTYSEEHEQLKNYNNQVENYVAWLKNNYKDCIVHLKQIFFKPMIVVEEEADRVRKANWDIFDIEEIHKIFSQFDDTDSDILNDYIKHIEKIYSACHFNEKPAANDCWIDWLQWLSFFNKIDKKINKEFYQTWITKAGQYPYVYMAIGIRNMPNRPYIEIQSKDCLANKYRAKLLCYGVQNLYTQDQIVFKQDKLIEKIKSDKKWLVKNLRKKEHSFVKQIAFTPNINVETEEDFVRAIKETLDYYLQLMETWEEE